MVRNVDEVVNALAFLEAAALDSFGYMAEEDRDDSVVATRLAVSTLLEALAMRSATYAAHKRANAGVSGKGPVPGRPQRCGRCGAEGHKRTTCPLPPRPRVTAG